ncbi:MAG: alpha/beta hydrolase-fold protein [Bacteroidota bacterium]|nr:alpha/beta hydrolase-fold protein [Bacteroidota bacterium]
MLKSISLITALLISLSLLSQNTVRLELQSLPLSSTAEKFYVAGSFNNWNPTDEQYRFKRDDDKKIYFVELQLAPGKYEYKITRGAWDKVETKKNGAGIDNRILVVPTNTAYELVIENWADRFPAQPKKSTASKNVQIMNDKFMLRELSTTRRIWIYLPPEYATSNKRYPVLYLHDGQNVFEDSSSFSGEWGVDEFMDTARSNCIVVAIDHGGPKRMNEYSPYDMDRFGKGEGKQYVDFLAKTLKPYIDKQYRTLKKKENTFIAGSSMGGLISMYAILKYPKIFGGAGVFSPAFWVAPGIFDDITKKGEKIKGKIYFYAGKQESESMVPDLLKAFEKMHAVSKANMTILIRDEGKHNESTWRKEFPLFYDWLYGVDF